MIFFLILILQEDYSCKIESQKRLLTFKHCWNSNRLWSLLNFDWMHFFIMIPHKNLGTRVWNVVVWKKMTHKGNGSIRCELCWGWFGLVGGSASLWRQVFRSQMGSIHTQCIRPISIACTRYRTLNYLSSTMFSCMSLCPTMMIMDWTSGLKAGYHNQMFSFTGVSVVVVFFSQ